MTGRIFFNPDGIKILEEIILEELIENPEQLREAAKRMEIDVDPMIMGALKDYFKIKKDLSRIRCGDEPVHYPISNYTPPKS